MTMLKLAGAPVDQDATRAYAHLFQALSDPSRLAVLQHLASGEHRVKDLVDHMGLAQSTVSNHLSFLSRCHLVEVRTEGRSSYYSLTDPEALAGVILAAEILLEKTGSNAVLCQHIRTSREGH